MENKKEKKKHKPFNLQNNFKEVVRKFQAMNMETIKTFKTMMFVLIVSNIFGVWWYLEAKTLASAILIILIIFLSIFLILERRLYDKMDEEEQSEDNLDEEEDDEEDEPEEKEKVVKKKKKKKKRVAEPNPAPQNFLADMGMDSESYNKRLENAIGTPGAGFQQPSFGI